MVTSTLISVSPEELEAMISRAVARHLDAPAVNVDFLTVDDIAKRSGFNRKTICSWITEGRRVQGGKIIKLRIVGDLTDGPYRIRPAQWETFKASFRDMAM